MSENILYLLPLSLLLFSFQFIFWSEAPFIYRKNLSVGSFLKFIYTTIHQQFFYYNKKQMRSYSLLFLVCAFFFASCPKEPLIEDDYWSVEDPLKLGFDKEGLNTALDNADGLSNFYSLLVIRNNKIAVEEYYNGKNANDLFHFRSITKNISSALAGIALEEELIDSVDTSLSKYYPDLITGDKETITIRNMLNMSSGVKWGENDEIIDVLNKLGSRPYSLCLV